MTHAKGLEVRFVPIGEVVPYVRNPRKNTAAIAKVAASIREFGWRQPIVCDAEMTVIAGHTRLEAARQLGLAEVPVHVAFGMTAAQVKAYRLADNRVSEEAEWDNGLLALELSELKDAGFELPLTGFDADELTALLAPSSDVLDGADLDDVPEPPADPVTKPGDLIVLGRHRVLCGDSTDAENAKRLIEGRFVAMMMTDPPYGLNRNLARAKGRDWRLKNDDDSAGKMYLALSHFGEIAERYVWGQWNTWTNLTDALGMPDNCIVWHKTQMGMGHGYRHQHEFCAYFGKRSFPSQGDVWVASRDHSGLHPTMKPVELLVRAIENSSSKGDVIVDPFLGSGSTLMAAEASGRTCFGIELEPKYCDVIVTRWEKATGQKATRHRAAA